MEKEGTYLLKNGEKVYIRPLRASDKDLFIKAFNRLSEQTKRLRFLNTVEKLSEKDYDYLTNIDHINHAAFCAYVKKEEENIGVGVVRYIRSIKQPSVAEIAITIIDEYQNKGVGKLLIEEIVAKANKEGINKFVANAFHFNNIILKIIGHYAYKITGSENGVLKIEISLPNESRD